MKRNFKTFAMMVLLMATCGDAVQGQVAPAVILEIDVENRVNYVDDISDISRLATDARVTAAIPSRNFRKSVVIGDIVAVNGQAVKGTFVGSFRQLTLTPRPNAGQAIADITRSSEVEFKYEFLKTDGTPIGTVIAAGFGAGAAPPGAPPGLTGGNVAIVGGTGAFLGARGQTGQAGVGQTTPESRVASMSEDPANRRNHGGGRLRSLAHIIPQSRPEAVVTPNGPSVFHSDFTAVSAARPARSGEVLIVTATNLGPTRPGVDPGKPFPREPLQEVNSPVEVLVNGQAAEVINKIGWPGLENVYRVDFRVPEGTAAGSASLQLVAAWIPGSPVSIQIQ